MKIQFYSLDNVIDRVAIFVRTSQPNMKHCWGANGETDWVGKHREHANILLQVCTATTFTSGRDKNLPIKRLKSF